MVLLEPLTSPAPAHIRGRSRGVTEVGDGGGGAIRSLYLAELNPSVACALSARTIPGWQVQLMVAVATAHA